MSSSDREIARRFLTAALDRLEQQPRPDPHISSLSDNGTPIILIVLDTSSPARADAADAPSQKALSQQPALNVVVLPHPGLERFPLREDGSTNSAPGQCFMEPDRACVNSGACEMRGH